MKKYLIMFLCLFMALCSYGQEESEHMTFKGIPIDGTFKEFTTQLKQKGFVQDEEYPEMFHGSFRSPRKPLSSSLFYYFSRKRSTAAGRVFFKISLLFTGVGKMNQIDIIICG